MFSVIEKDNKEAPSEAEKMSDNADSTESQPAVVKEEIKTEGKEEVKTEVTEEIKPEVTEEVKSEELNSEEIESEPVVENE